MKSPLAGIAVIFALGISFANFLNLSALFIYLLVAAVLSVILFCLRKKLKFDFWLLLFIFLSGALALKNAQSLPLCHILKILPPKNNQPCIVKGFIISEPEIKYSRISFKFKLEELQINQTRKNCCGYIFVYAKSKKNLHYGEELILKGDLCRFYGNNNFKRKTYYGYLYNQGISAIIRVGSTNDIAGLNKNKGSICQRLAFRLKDKIEKLIFKYVAMPSASILDAMLLGEKRNVPPVIYNSMVKSGTVHILVVSGFNVGIVAFIIVLFLKLMRFPRHLRFYLATPLLVLYCLITGASTPVLRATIMAIFFLFGYLVKREPGIYSSLALAALLILGTNPRQLFDVGFQLSFASVLSIAYFYPKLKFFLHLEALKSKCLRHISEGLLVSFSAWLGTLGFIAYYFRIFSPITILANLLIVPLASLITLSGFSLIMAALIWLPLAPAFAACCGLLVALLLEANFLLLKFPLACLILS